MKDCAQFRGNRKKKVILYNFVFDIRCTVYEFSLLFNIVLYKLKNYRIFLKILTGLTSKNLYLPLDLNIKITEVSEVVADELSGNECLLE